MAVELEGGCRVSVMNEGTPEIAGNMKMWRQIGTSTGAKAVSLRIVEFDEGRSPLIRNDEFDEVFYYLESFEEDRQTASQCTVQLDGRSFDLEPETGFLLQAGKVLSVLNPSNAPVVLVGVQCPKSANNKDATSFPGVRLTDRAATTTADRWYRVLVDDEVGSSQVTQFVGSIPPGRAPDHFHQYEEVLFILRGQGRMWAGQTNTPIGPGSCIYLPRKQVHCVENTGTNELRLLGVFYPAGSPSVRYDA
ncbi:MAG TPA: cupin domain-containing protein [Pyrinomonadaceae bacterium]